MAHILSENMKENIRVVFIDVPRAKCEAFNHAIIEEIKDGNVTASKYFSTQIRWSTNTHVVLLMNSDPDMEAFSPDRYHIIYPGQS